MSPTNRVKLSTALTVIAAVANAQELPVSEMYLALTPDPNGYGINEGLADEDGFPTSAGYRMIYN